MDCTQVLESDELNDSVAYKYKVKVAELKVNDSLYPIFSGSNRIGRDPEFCSVVFNNMTLSKEHAVIEVEDRFTHLIYDLGSKNKTRVGKTILKPHIRYQLLDKSEILLGDLLAEYFVIPEDEENKPYAVIQESDDDIIPDTPVQSKSRESKESSSSREESPTIFQMETQCQLGYEEPCMKIAQEPKLEEMESNLAESSHRQDESKETCATGASSTSSTVSAAGSSEVNIGENDVRESTREVNHASDGDETDPEDVFFAMTQKRDSLLELSDKEGSSDVKEMVENEEPEVRDHVENNSNVCETVEKSEDDTTQPDTEIEMVLPSSPKEDDDMLSISTRAGVEEAKKINGKEQEQGEAEKINGKEQEQGEKNSDFHEEERSNENEENQKETGGSSSEETNNDGKFPFSIVIKEPKAENESESKNLFKVPLAADKEEEKREQTAQVILPVSKENTGEREETGDLNSETSNDSDDDSIFNAATQVIQQESPVTEVFKKPLAVKALDRETGSSPERNKSCDNPRANEGPGDSTVLEDKSEGSPNVSVQVVHSENKEESSSGGKQEIQEQDPSLFEGKSRTTEKDDLEDSDSTTDDESSFFNAPTQVIHTGNEEAGNRNVSPPSAEPENPNCNEPPHGKEPCEKDVQEEEEIVGTSDVVTETDDSIFNAPTQVLHVERKETIASSDEKEIEPSVEQKQLPGTSIGRLGESDSIFEAATQVVHPENSPLDSLETSSAEEQTERKGSEQKHSVVVPNSETKIDDSIYEAETQVLYDHSQVRKATVTFKTSTPAKKKCVQFADVDGEQQDSKSKAIPEEQSKEQDAVVNNESYGIFRAPNQVVETRNQESTSSKAPSGVKALKECISAEGSRGFVSDPEINRNELDVSSEDQIRQLDDSDDSIFSAPTQIISKSNPMRDSVSPIAGPEENFNSSSSVSTKEGPEPAVQIDENNEEKIRSEQDPSDVSKVTKRNEDEFNDSFFEAPTQLYASTTLAEELDSPDDEKANKSLSRSSSYSSIHEAPTQCMDDLVAGLDSKTVDESAVKGPEESGPSSNIQEGEKEISEGNSVEKPSEMLETPAATTSKMNYSIDLILPSSQELREVGQECYGYTSDDERPSTSKDTSSPIIQKRTRSIPIKKGILMAEGLKSVKPTVATNSKSAGTVSFKPLTDSVDKEQTAIESKKEPKKPLKERRDRKKSAGRRKIATVKENDNTKKITDYLESNNARPKNSEQGSKIEENKVSDDPETGRPSRQRKPTWKARESSEDVLPAATPKTKKGENTEQSKVSPGSSKHVKKHAVAPSDVCIPKEDKNRKDKSKHSTKVNSEPCLNSESHLGDSEKGGGKSENSNVSESPSTQRKTSVCSVSPSRSEDEDATTKKGVKMKQSIKEADKSKSTESSISPCVETKSRSSSLAAKRKQTSVDQSSFKKRGRTCLLSSSSDQDDQKEVDNSSKESNVSTSNVDSKPEKSTTRSRRKPSNIPPPPSDQKQDISSVHGNLQIENKKRKGRSKQSTIGGDSSVTNLVSIPEDGKTQHDNVSVASDGQGNADEHSSNVPDTKVSVGKRGRQKRTTTAISALSSDIEAIPVDDVYTSSDKQTESIIQSHDDKNLTVPVTRRGRSKRPTTNSTSSTEVEIKSEGTRTRNNSSYKQRADSSSPHDQLDVKTRGRSTRSAASRASSVEAEGAESVTHNKRTSDSDICGTPVKQRKTSVTLSGNVLEKNADVKRGKAKRTTNKAFEVDKESNPAVRVSQEQRVEESDVCGTPKKQRKTNVTSLDSGEVEIVETKRKGRSKRSAIPAVPLASKKQLISTTNVTSPDINTQPALTTPRSTKQKRSILQPLDKTPSKTNDVSEQERPRSRKKSLNILVADEDQTACSSPSYGSAGRRRKVLSQASSTESDGHSSQSEGTPKRSSRIKHHISYHIMFTGVGCTSADETAIKKLGGMVVQEPEDCTILITDKIRRTLKFLCILGQGKPIVTPEWIKQSHLSGHFLDPWKFIVKDKEAEKKYNFQLQKSLKEASNKKLLDGYSVFATPSVKPPPVEMKGIVENSGGQFLTKDPSPGKWPEKSFIISAVDDKKLCSKFKKSSVPIVSTEIVLTGILQQKLKLNDYILKL